MNKKVVLNSDGIVSRRQNLPLLPSLKVNTNTQAGRKLVRLHNLISGDAPNICIKRGPGIGDLLMLTPVIRFISEQYPMAKITVATDMKYLGGALPAILKHIPFIHNVVDWDQKNIQDDYDVFLDEHCPCVAHEKPGALPVSRMDLFARHIGINKLDNPLPEYIIHPDELEIAKEYLSSNIKWNIQKDKVIIVNPFASAAGRCVHFEPLKRALVRLSEDPNIKIIIIKHTDSDFADGSMWENYSHCIAKNLGIRELAPLIKLSHLLICPDSALMHLAAAINSQALALFGPTDARARTDQYPSVTPLWPGGTLKCMCWYGYASCVHLSCWKMIRDEDILNASLRILDGQNPKDYNKILADIKNKFAFNQNIKSTIKSEEI